MADEAGGESAFTIDRQTLDALPMVVFELDADGRLRPGACGGGHPRNLDRWGLEVGEQVAEVLGAESRLGRMVQTALEGGLRSTLDVPLADRTYLTTVDPRRDETGAVVGVVVVGIDVTDAREFRSRLESRDEQLRLLVDTALDAVITIDVASRILDWNTGAERLFGWTRDEALEMTLGETVIPPDLRAAHEAGMKRFLASGEGPVLGKRIEIEAIDRAGRRFPIELAINPIPTPGGMVFSAFLRDITTRVEAERRLASSEYRLRSALDAMRAGAWDLQLDSVGGVVSAEADERTIELVGEDVGMMPAARSGVHPDDRALVSRAWLAHVSGTEPRYEVEYRVVDRDGVIGWRRELGMLVREEGDDADGASFAGKFQRPRRMIGMVTEETAAHQLEDTLAAARKLEAVGQVASGFAHDLNNMLAAVLGNATLAATPPDLPERTRKALETIKESVARGRALTQNLLMLGKPGRVKRGQVEPRAIIESTIELARPILGAVLGEALTVDVEEEIPKIECDGNQLQQALLNVLINARDALHGVGRITLRSGLSDEQDERGRPMVFIEIIDDGPGMPPDVLEAATRPFFSTKGERGTGLGLAMVDGFVTECGGRLAIESSPGAGTTVRLLLPAARGAAMVGTRRSAAGSAEAAGESPDRPLQVLVVEDHPLLRPMLVEALINGGCQVEGVGDGDAAMDAAARLQPDVVVLDVNLPGRRGDEVALALRETLGRETPVIFITGNADFVPPAWTDVVLLRKPFELHEMLTQVFALVGRSQG